MGLRLAEQRDISALTEIYNQAIARRCTADTDPFTVEQRQGFLDAHRDSAYPLYVLEHEGQCVGYVYLTAYRPGRKAMRYLAEVSYYVHDSFQRQGYGSQLLAFAINMARQLGYRQLVAILLNTNEGSVALLEKYQFERWGMLPDVADFDGQTCSHLYYGLRLREF
ncbi:Acetyltransferase (GNAT) domain [Carpediemonas membranifera]|uniref:Acetyltransferase (GNAT) domain n=1 Tax=Carpediemonas membranifera TaxID=201153 RepID=A0A8J6BBC9_9EUKA|nr:Acetyltransferase (GNAT) domain [Carpediemonas membranifera]|eukprot:KAG9393822.1 Acetyltransferase (GNAT) domain [Carpediemonas membranifera]